MDQAGSRNVPVVWVLLPVMRTPEGTAAARLTNEIITQAAQGRANVTARSHLGRDRGRDGAYMPYFNDLEAGSA